MSKTSTLYVVGMDGNCGEYAPAVELKLFDSPTPPSANALDARGFYDLVGAQAHQERMRKKFDGILDPQFIRIYEVEV